MRLGGSGLRVDTDPGFFDTEVVAGLRVGVQRG